MPATVSKRRLSLLLLFLQLFVYLYVLPREPPPEQGYPLEADCKASYPGVAGCLAGRAYFRELARRCGRSREERPAPSEEPAETPPSEEPAETTPSEEPAETPPSEEPAETPPSEEPAPPPVNLSDGPPRKERQDEPRPGHLIYQVIVVLLFLSVSFALADCFQERAKKRGLPEECERHDGLSRRMSLADLTMSRHARKESQASYRPLGEKRPLLATRSCSHEVPMKTKAVIRQTSCPQFDDDASTERRRVRMIQRH